MSDVIVTWPKSKSLDDYLADVKLAHKMNRNVSFRVASEPKHLVDGDRCYMVWDGQIRGWLKIVGWKWMHEGRVIDVDSGGYWRAGWYIIRTPIWHPLKGIGPFPMKGFRGFRYVPQDMWRDLRRSR